SIFTFAGILIPKVAEIFLYKACEKHPVNKQIKIKNKNMYFSCFFMDRTLIILSLRICHLSFKATEIAIKITPIINKPKYINN
ncbi:MAG TPA: hypothetical protein PLJ57_06650, partial [Tepidanaerobacteraceae bacterium]|nr:hypothetical protein [Tepidanaerobacteraceae bacterium]